MSHSSEPENPPKGSRTYRLPEPTADFLPQQVLFGAGGWGAGPDNIHLLSSQLVLTLRASRGEPLGCRQPTLEAPHPALFLPDPVSLRGAPCLTIRLHGGGCPSPLPQTDGMGHAATCPDLYLQMPHLTLPCRLFSRLDHCAGLPPAPPTRPQGTSSLSPSARRGCARHPVPHPQLSTHPPRPHGHPRGLRILTLSVTGLSSQTSPGLTFPFLGVLAPPHPTHTHSGYPLHSPDSQPYF